MPSAQKESQKQSQSGPNIVDTTAREKESKSGPKFGKDSDETGRRDFTVCDRRVVLLLAKHATTVQRLEVRIRKGSAAYSDWRVFMLEPDVDVRKRFERPEVQDWAARTGQEAWDEAFKHTQQHGPVLDFQFEGYAVTKNGKLSSKFTQACRCRTDQGGFEPYDHEADYQSTDHNALLRAFADMHRIDVGHQQKLINSIADPLRAVGDLQAVNLDRARETIEWQRRLADEELQSKLQLNELEKFKHKWNKVESIANRALTIVENDLVDPLASFFRARGDGPLPDDLRQISQELAELHTVYQSLHMPKDLRRDLLALWDRCTSMASELEAASAWHGFHDDLVRHLPEYRQRARSGRQRSLLSKARARIGLYPEAQPPDGIQW